MGKKKKMEIEDLAVMVKNGFDGVDERFDRIEGRLGKVEGKISAMENSLDDVRSRVRNIERDVAHIHDTMVQRDEFDDLAARVKYVEFKMGIVSGK